MFLECPVPLEYNILIYSYILCISLCKDFAVFVLLCVGCMDFVYTGHICEPR